MAKDKKKPTSAAQASRPAFDPKPMKVDEGIVERLKPHMAKIAAVVGAGILILIIVAIVVYFQNRHSEKHTAKVAAVLDVASRPVEAPGQPAPPAGKQQPFKDEKEKATGILDAIAKQGVDASPAFHASALLEAGKLDEAIAEYKKGQHQAGLDGVLAREGLGIALEEKAAQDKDATARQKDLEAALDAFKAMQPLQDGPRRAFALYHQGRVLDELGKKADAKAALEKAKELGKDTVLPQLVNERLAVMGGS